MAGGVQDTQRDRAGAQFVAVGEVAVERDDLRRSEHPQHAGLLRERRVER